MRRQRGFTLLGLLAIMVVTGIGLASAATLWSHQRQREQERELIRIGSAYAAALESYFVRSPGSSPQHPRELSELLLDHRFVGTVRHLRRLYTDPLQPNQPWQLIHNDEGQIVGVRSASQRRPIAAGAVDGLGRPLKDAHTYSDWIFVSPKAKP